MFFVLKFYKSPTPHRTRQAQAVVRDSPSSQLGKCILRCSTFVVVSSHFNFFSFLYIILVSNIFVLYSPREVSFFEVISLVG